jgi:hypothetical protein
VWFKTGVAGGILLGEANQPFNSPTAPSTAVTPLYVDTTGKLRGGFYTSGQLVSGQTVTDNQWHHAVLVGAGDKQRLYLDGVEVPGSPLTGIGHLDMKFSALGGGYSSGGWTAQPPVGWRSFNGSISDASLWERPLTGRKCPLCTVTPAPPPARSPASCARRATRRPWWSTTTSPAA